jgi:hypothetical protein
MPILPFPEDFITGEEAIFGLEFPDIAEFMLPNEDGLSVFAIPVVNGNLLPAELAGLAGFTRTGSADFAGFTPPIISADAIDDAGFEADIIEDPAAVVMGFAATDTAGEATAVIGAVAGFMSVVIFFIVSSTSATCHPAPTSVLLITS